MKNTKMPPKKVTLKNDGKNLLENLKSVWVWGIQLNQEN